MTRSTPGPFSFVRRAHIAMAAIVTIVAFATGCEEPRPPASHVHARFNGVHFTEGDFQNAIARISIDKRPDTPAQYLNDLIINIGYWSEKQALAMSRDESEKLTRDDVFDAIGVMPAYPPPTEWHPELTAEAQLMHAEAAKLLASPGVTDEDIDASWERIVAEVNEPRLIPNADEWAALLRRSLSVETFPFNMLPRDALELATVRKYYDAIYLTVQAYRRGAAIVREEGWHEDEALFAEYEEGMKWNADAGWEEHERRTHFWFVLVEQALLLDMERLRREHLKIDDPQLSAEVKQYMGEAPTQPTVVGGATLVTLQRVPWTVEKMQKEEMFLTSRLRRDLEKNYEESMGPLAAP